MLISILQIYFYIDLTVILSWLKITELKAEHWEKEKEFRQKIIQMQKDNADRIESLQVCENYSIEK